jgi:hypothetical protein
VDYKHEDYTDIVATFLVWAAERPPGSCRGAKSHLETTGKKKGTRIQSAARI